MKSTFINQLFILGTISAFIASCGVSPKLNNIKAASFEDAEQPTFVRVLSYDQTQGTFSLTRCPELVFPTKIEDCVDGGKELGSWKDEVDFRSSVFSALKEVALSENDADLSSYLEGHKKARTNDYLKEAQKRLYELANRIFQLQEYAKTLEEKGTDVSRLEDEIKSLEKEHESLESEI